MVMSMMRVRWEDQELRCINSQIWLRQHSATNIRRSNRDWKRGWCVETWWRLFFSPLLFSFPPLSAPHRLSHFFLAIEWVSRLMLGQAIKQATCMMKNWNGNGFCGDMVWIGVNKPTNFVLPVWTCTCSVGVVHGRPTLCRWLLSHHAIAVLVQCQRGGIGLTVPLQSGTVNWGLIRRRRGRVLCANGEDGAFSRRGGGGVGVTWR